jgi:hypothetical protein
MARGSGRPGRRAAHRPALSPSSPTAAPTARLSCCAAGWVSGEIRATGDVLIDQLVQMQRSGFDSAVLRAGVDAWHAQRQFERFTAFYQGDAVNPQPLFARPRLMSARPASGGAVPGAAARQPTAIEINARAVRKDFDAKLAETSRPAAPRPQRGLTRPPTQACRHQPGRRRHGDHPSDQRPCTRSPSSCWKPGMLHAETLALLEQLKQLPTRAPR